MTYQIVCIGEPLAEISKGHDGVRIGYGGDTLNTAIYCARETEGQDVRVHYVTILGEDAASLGALDLMQSEGISTDFVRQDPDRQIGIYAIQNDPDGERHFHYWRDGSAARRLFSEPKGPEFDAVAAADLAYLSGITLAILEQSARDRLFDALAARRDAGGLVAFDPNYRPKLWHDKELARQETERFWTISDIALPTIDDEVALFGKAEADDVIKRLHGYGLTQGALKCGATGPVPLANLGDLPNFAPATRVTDTTSAGDSFNGGYLAALALGEAEVARLAKAHALAREVVGHQGAILPRPSTEPRRLGSVIRLKPEHAEAYIKLHADVWPGVLDRLRKSNFTNYSIFLKRPEHLMFGYFEYVGNDFAADSAAIAADPVTQDWWSVCGPMQDPFDTRADGEWWAEMEPIFYLK